MVGMGTVITKSASYKATFTNSPKGQNDLAAAINLSMMGLLPGFINNSIVFVVSSWFLNKDSTKTAIKNTEAYVISRVEDCYWILVALVFILSVSINSLSPVKNFVEHVVNGAIDATRIKFLQMGEDVC